jgi:hypothetical protein
MRLAALTGVTMAEAERPRSAERLNCLSRRLTGFWVAGCRSGSASATIWRDRLERLGELLMKARVHGTMPDLCGCGIRAKTVAALPVILRPDGSGAKAAATVRADVGQKIFGARAAEGALKSADHRVQGIRRQRGVAVLTGGSQFKHGGIFPARPEGGMDGDDIVMA